MKSRLPYFLLLLFAFALCTGVFLASVEGWGLPPLTKEKRLRGSGNLSIRR